MVYQILQLHFETHLKVEDEFFDQKQIMVHQSHGIDGPLSVSDQRIHLPLLDEFQNAAEEFGIPKTKDFNTGDNHDYLLY